MEKTFRARLKMKPELWLGCEVAEVTTLFARHGSYPKLRFKNFPWIVTVGPVEGRILAIRKYGEFPSQWPDPMGAEHLVAVGDVFCIKVEQRHLPSDPSCVFVSPRIVL